ncbi:hypothetical protein L596_008538 [Steinernema carpocapsae]|uniref:Uncharacterized protein n=1 Tax=Steinernema carpocapsae TaxID=34508 RepID=A0A4U5PD28_STECR|nr:hypothetical protein L596_008538 [Steinernema carpocapsae]
MFDYAIVRSIVDALDDVHSLENLRVADLGSDWSRLASRRQRRFVHKVLRLDVHPTGGIGASGYFCAPGFIREVDAWDDGSILDDFDQLEITGETMRFGAYNAEIEEINDALARNQKILHMLQIHGIKSRNTEAVAFLRTLRIPIENLWISQVTIDPSELCDFLHATLSSGCVRRLKIDASECNRCLQKALKIWIQKTPQWVHCELVNLEFADSIQVNAEIIQDFINDWRSGAPRAPVQVFSVLTEGRFLGEALEVMQDHPKHLNAGVFFSYDGHSSCRMTFTSENQK